MAGAENDIHAKILRSGQYRMEDSKYIVQAPRVFKKTKEQEVDESTKKIEDLREEMKKVEREAAVKLERSEKESEEMIEKAESEAERIVKESEKSAFERVEKSLEEKDNYLQEKRNEGENIINEAKKAADQVLHEASLEADRIKADAKKIGYENGKDEGFEIGKNEIISITERLKSIIAAMLEEREKILIHSERQIVNLIISMVKKVVKKLTQEEESVVINNTKEALSIIRGAMKVYIHVNPEDYNFTTRHKDELIKIIEGMPEVKFFEDPVVDRGGVFIETDVGEIDAKISTQLEEIEDKIRFYMPVKIKGKGLDQHKPESDETLSEVKNAEVVPM